VTQNTGQPISWAMSEHAKNLKKISRHIGDNYHEIVSGMVNMPAPAFLPAFVHANG